MEYPTVRGRLFRTDGARLDMEKVFVRFVFVRKGEILNSLISEVDDDDDDDGTVNVSFGIEFQTP